MLHIRADEEAEIASVIHPEAKPWRFFTQGPLSHWPVFQVLSLCMSIFSQAASVT